MKTEISIYEALGAEEEIREGKRPASDLLGKRIKEGY
jgi:hypothetical protein